VHASIAISPETSAETAAPALELVDMVLVMTVHPGYSGQEFMPEILPKISQMRAMLDKVNPAAWIEVDGGISRTTLPKTKAAGANVFVAASAIYKHPAGIAAGVKELREQFD
jgi:ribulose-phosphate 3-epimerase